MAGNEIVFLKYDDSLHCERNGAFLVGHERNLFHAMGMS